MIDPKLIRQWFIEMPATSNGDEVQYIAQKAAAYGAEQAAGLPETYFGKTLEPVTPDYFEHQDDDDCWRESPDDCDIIDSAGGSDLIIGDEYECEVAWRGTQRFRVTKIPDDSSDDYAVKLVASSHEFYTAKQLKQANAAILADGQGMKAFEDWPKFHCQGLGCGLEDRGITDRYEAAEYGWRDCEERMLEQGPFVTLESAQQAVAAERAKLDDVSIWRYNLSLDLDAAKKRITDLEAALHQAQGELTDEEILDLAEPFGAFQYGDSQGDTRKDFARAVLAAQKAKP